MFVAFYPAGQQILSARAGPLERRRRLLAPLQLVKYSQGRVVPDFCCFWGEKTGFSSIQQVEFGLFRAAAMAG